MSDSDKPGIGTIGWHDLTVENAEQVRDFYQEVVGWKSQGVSMGDYEDFGMATPESGEGIAGVCHARGVNDNLPPQWLMYVVVADVDQSAARCVALGGAVIAGPRALGEGRFCVIRDPAGAVCALYTP